MDDTVQSSPSCSWRIEAECSAKGAIRAQLLLRPPPFMLTGPNLLMAFKRRVRKMDLAPHTGRLIRTLSV